MKSTLTENITRTEELFAINPNDKLIESYLKQLYSLKNVPDVYLNDLYGTVTLIYEAIKEYDDRIQIATMIGLFDNMIESIKIQVMAENPDSDYPELYNDVDGNNQ